MLKAGAVATITDLMAEEAARKTDGSPA